MNGVTRKRRERREGGRGAGVKMSCQHGKTG